MKKNIVIELKNGKEILATHNRPGYFNADDDNLLILMVNGFPKNSVHANGFNPVLAAEINKMGLSSLQFDFTHCHEKNLETEKFNLRTASTDFDILFSWAEAEGYKKFAYVAEGLGAPLAFANAPAKLKFSILFWPIFDLRHALVEQFRIKDHRLTLEEKEYLDYMETRIGQKLLLDLEDMDLEKTLGQIKAPALIFQGNQDEIVPAQHLDFARKHMKSRRIDITTFENGVHGLENRNHRETCLHLAKEFIDRYSDPINKEPENKQN